MTSRKDIATAFGYGFVVLLFFCSWWVLLILGVLFAFFFPPILIVLFVAAQLHYIYKTVRRHTWDSWTTTTP